MTAITGSVKDVTGVEDNETPWSFASVIRFAEDGSVITEKPREVRAVSGTLKVNLVPGYAIVTYGKHVWQVDVPETPTTLKALIEAGVAYPPDTPQALLDAAVGQYVETHREQFRTRAVPVEGDPLMAQWVDEYDNPVGDPVPWSQVISEQVAYAAAEAQAPAAAEAFWALQAPSVVAGTEPDTVRQKFGDTYGPNFPAVMGLWEGIAGKPADYYHASLVADRTGATESTTELQDLIDDAGAAGGGTVYFDGAYVTDPLTVPANVRILLDDRSVIKLKDNATAVGGKLAPLIVGGSNVSIVGGVIDGNRAGQSQSAYNTAGGSPVIAGGGVLALGSQGSPLTGLDIDTHVINAVDYGLRATWVKDSTFDVRITDSGCGASFSYCDNLTGQGVALTRIDGSGWKLYPHAIDFMNTTRVRFDLVTSVYHHGTGQVGAGTALSDWISGVTLVGSSDIAIGTLSVDTLATNVQAKGVGVSMLSCANLRIGSLRVAGYSDCLLEMGGVVDSQINIVDLDGRYQSSTLGAASGVGWKIANYGFYPGLASRSQRFTERNTFGNLNIRRCRGQGVYVTGGRRNTFMGGRVYGCRIGVRAIWLSTSSEDNFTTQMKRDLDGNKWIGVDCSYNEDHGWDIRDGANTQQIGCRGSNNGQAITKGAARAGGTVTTTPSGFYFGTSTTGGGLSKTGITVIGPEGTDTQSFTDALSGISANGAVLSALDPERYVPGQTIKLLGAGAAGADLITRVQDVSLDEVTLEDAPSTWPTVAGTGTISSSGTSLTGAGTAFATELNARYFITADGQTRQIVKTADDTHATTATAFSPALPAGTSFVIKKIVTNGMPSQMYGCYFSADTLAPQLMGGILVGNTTSPVADNTTAGANKLRAIATPGTTTTMLNSLASDSFVSAYDNSGAVRTRIGQIGPSGQGGVGVGVGGAAPSNVDVALYRFAANQWRTENALILGNQGAAPGAPATGAVLYVESGSLKVKGSSGTVTVLGPA